MGTYCLVFTEANNGSELRMPKCPMANYCQFPVSKATFIDSAMYEKSQLSLFFCFCLFAFGSNGSKGNRSISEVIFCKISLTVNHSLLVLFVPKPSGLQTALLYRLHQLDQLQQASTAPPEVESHLDQG